MKSNYKAVLFHPSGDYVTDFRDSETKQSVWDSVADMGSKWVFYPICFVATDKTIVDAPDGLEFMKHKRIKTVSKLLASKVDELCEAINNNWPLHHIFPVSV